MGIRGTPLVCYPSTSNKKKGKLCFATVAVFKSSEEIAYKTMTDIIREEISIKQCSAHMDKISTEPERETVKKIRNFVLEALKISPHSDDWIVIVFCDDRAGQEQTTKELSQLFHDPFKLARTTWPVFNQEIPIESGAEKFHDAVAHEEGTVHSIQHHSAVVVPAFRSVDLVKETEVTATDHKSMSEFHREAIVNGDAKLRAVQSHFYHELAKKDAHIKHLTTELLALRASSPSIPSCAEATPEVLSVMPYLATPVHPDYETLISDFIGNPLSFEDIKSQPGKNDQMIVSQYAVNVAQWWQSTYALSHESSEDDKRAEAYKNLYSGNKDRLKAQIEKVAKANLLCKRSTGLAFAPP